MELILGYRRAASNFPSCKKFRECELRSEIGFIYFGCPLDTDTFWQVSIMLFLGYSVGLEAEERRDTRLFPDRTRRKLWAHFDLYSSVIHVIILHFHSIFF